jgi:hypothetical protein
MPLSQAIQRFFTSTRGHIVRLLRRGGHTVEELAQALDLTEARNNRSYQKSPRRKTLNYFSWSLRSP